MDEKMEFPNTLDEFIRQYSFIDEEQIYTNGIELIPVFRIRQWEEHKKEENQELKKQLEKKYEKVGTLTGELLYEENTRLINQQKEFIEWLEQKVKKYTVISILMMIVTYM